jgi:hypothetical protein
MPETGSFIVVDSDGDLHDYHDVHSIQLQDGALWLMGENRSILHLYAPGAWLELMAAEVPSE